MPRVVYQIFVDRFAAGVGVKEVRAILDAMSRPGRIVATRHELAAGIPKPGQRSDLTPYLHPLPRGRRRRRLQIRPVSVQPNSPNAVKPSHEFRFGEGTIRKNLGHGGSV